MRIDAPEVSSPVEATSLMQHHLELAFAYSEATEGSYLETLKIMLDALVLGWNGWAEPVEIREVLETTLRELRLRAIADRDPARTTSERAADGLMGSP